jgi:hypothetical protein
MDKLTEQHEREAKKAAQVQRQEIEQLKAQRLEDIANRSREILMAQAKVDEQDEATRQLRQESVQTKHEISALRSEMQQMVQQMMLAFSKASVNQDNKRRGNDNGDGNNTPSEKRRDVRSTPGKKLYFDEQNLQDSTLYMDAIGAASTTDQSENE